MYDRRNLQAFAAAYYEAATETKETRLEHGSRLNKFILAHDIEMWSTAFLDPSWTHEVIRATEVCLSAHSASKPFSDFLTCYALDNNNICRHGMFMCL